MGYIKRGNTGLLARIGWERTSDWQVIPTQRRLFHTARLAPTRVPALLLWALALSLTVGIGHILMHRWW
ncbi:MULTISPECIES: hypothetical protein [Ralstonia solanacearum species complex]|uniref:hypothetical protein n=1 Tax=Ralstonia solanacearum species complex TaxID=3116862 RepID=UPI000E58B6AF|nr:hypothetical protein [Ralstonia solanacearum]BEU74795.1 hypothetical protein MAFF211271_43500 [Ralstonia pseudosolanacearum]AXV79613.1 hypothetical protein CJO76_22175 [Ralstonia solanacearum]AXV93641.1 hypothetical protein CJO79_22155 [Ralstonia solanacearum]AXW21643.1 hypothetical protein CJO85_22260 [Ralstonia solanacearum]AXW78531.1 hypothetical protein CJO97_22155 [Ralstonia solanacearum]